MDELFALGKRVLENQPFSASLETQLEVFEAGKAVLVLPVRYEMTQLAASGAKGLT